MIARHFGGVVRDRLSEDGFYRRDLSRALGVGGDQLPTASCLWWRRDNRQAGSRGCKGIARCRDLRCGHFITDTLDAFVDRDDTVGKHDAAIDGIARNLDAQILLAVDRKATPIVGQPQLQPEARSRQLGRRNRDRCPCRAAAIGREPKPIEDACQCALAAAIFIIPACRRRTTARERDGSILRISNHRCRTQLRLA